MRAFDPDRLRETLRPWLLDHVCPFWLDRVLDPRGGFLEALAPDGEPDPSPRRTTLVQARLTYVFSHAFALDARPRFRAAAEHGRAFLERALSAPSTPSAAGATPGSEGWYRAVDRRGLRDRDPANDLAVSPAVLDPTRDTYDHAFVLLAMAWYFRATGDASALGIADATYAFLERSLADHTHGGFAEETAETPPSDTPTSAKLPRRQNPHMHILEGTLALHAATRRPEWLARSRTLVELFRARCLDPITGAVLEYFGEDWSPAPGAQGEWREPGHQFEWVWLLFEYFRATRDDTVVPLAERLFRFGSVHGIDRTPSFPEAVFDGVGARGEVVADTKLLWPQTEYVKACVARAEFLGGAASREAAAEIPRHLGAIARHFLRPDGASWHNQIARDGTPAGLPTPARVLYHLFFAVAEVDRLLALQPGP
jgi:mannose/cellobiose epimerase-like protein (N-acyl-D-glucosamine 2-epimerase family)